MGVQFVLGRAGSGKTRHCLRTMADALNDHRDNTRLILIVPEQASFQMERALATSCAGGAFWRAEVLSFSRLAQRVFDETGSPPPLLRPRARRMALRAVAAAAPQARLAFGAASGSRGFFNELDRFIEEMLSERVTPDALLAAAGRLADAPPGRRAAAAATLYAAYLQWLGPDRLDPAQRYEELRRRLESADFLRGARMWIDGFAGFTAEETFTLTHLARVSQSVQITSLVDPDREDGGSGPSHESPFADAQAADPLDLFGRTRRTIAALTAQLISAGIEVLPPIVSPLTAASRLAGSAPLQALEQSLVTEMDEGGWRTDAVTATPRGGAPSSAQPGAVEPHGLHLVECISHRDELRAAARLIRSTVQSSAGTVTYRDFALIARDLEPHWRLVQEVLSEFEIPFFLDRRSRDADHALFRLVAALLEYTTRGFSVPAMSELLTGGLIDEPRIACEQLESMLRRAGPSAEHAWHDAENDARRLRGRNDSDAGDSRPRTAIRQRMRQAESALRGARHETAADARPIDGRAWRMRLEQAIDHLGARAMLDRWLADARRDGDWAAVQIHAQAWESLLELLDDFESVFAGTPMTATEFSDALTHGLADSTGAIAPPTLDQVLVASIERSRHPDVRHAWLMAFNDGVFPRPAADDALLRSGERDALRAAGLTSLPTARDAVNGDRLLAYVAMTRASRSLHISHATIGADGQSMRPSTLLNSVSPFASSDTRDTSTGAPPASVAEFARSYLADHREPRSGPSPRLQRLRQDLERQSATKDRVRNALSGLSYRNQPTRLPLDASPWRGGHATACVLRRDREGDAECESRAVRSVGASEIEAFVDCPFKHYAHHRLRLDRPARPDPFQQTHGTVAHAALALVTRAVIDSAADVKTITQSRWTELLDQAWPAAVARAIGQLSVAREIELMARLKELVNEALLAQGDRWRRGEWQPVAAELSFGSASDAESIPPLLLVEPRDDRPGVALIGRIDRVDARITAGRIDYLVFDYKSDARSLHTQQLTGQPLQLHAYMLALQSAGILPASPVLPPAIARQSRVVGAFVVPLYPAASEAGKQQFRAEAGRPEVQRMLLLRPRGVVAESVALSLDESLDGGVSPVANLRLRSDGGFYQSSDARPESGLRAMLALALRTLRQEGERLAEGRLEIAPLLQNRTLACTRCDYRAVCRFDRTVHVPRVAERCLPILTDADAAHSVQGNHDAAGDGGPS